MPPKPKSASNSNSSSNSHPHLKPGSVVEVSSDDDGFRGSWFVATVVRRCAAKKNQNKFLVEYKTIMADEKGTKPLREMLDVQQLRPPAPRESDRKFKFGEEVDAYHNDGWWEGSITEELPNGRFAVYFRASKEQIEFGKEDLRLHREWNNGKWEPPLEEQVKQKILRVQIKSSETEEGMFCKGTLVEVSNDEEGFEGAWFAATVVEQKGKDKFLIEYLHLRTDDGSENLREECDIFHIRPYPPEHICDRFSLLQEVDALYNDGWWVGVISRVLSNMKYVVYFKNTKEELEFPHSDLRLHQDWMNGKWLVPSKVDQAVSMAFVERSLGNYVRIHSNGIMANKKNEEAQEFSGKTTSDLVAVSEEMLGQKSVESVLFQGKKVVENTNMEKLELFGGEIINLDGFSQ